MESNIKYINWDAKRKKWHVQPRIKGEKVHVGWFSELDDAIKALAVLLAKNGMEIEPKINTDIDLTGKRFGKLVVKNKVSGYGTSALWHCICDCGNEKDYFQKSLVYNQVISCGCERKKRAAERMKENVGILEGTNASKLTTQKYGHGRTGRKGVGFTKEGKYCAYITFKGKRYWLGTFARLEDAIAARKEAEENLFDSFLEWYALAYPEQWKKFKKENP